VNDYRNGNLAENVERKKLQQVKKARKGRLGFNVAGSAYAVWVEPHLTR